LFLFFLLKNYKRYFYTYYFIFIFVSLYKSSEEIGPLAVLFSNLLAILWKIPHGFAQNVVKNVNFLKIWHYFIQFLGNSTGKRNVAIYMYNASTAKTKPNFKNLKTQLFCNLMMGVLSPKFGIRQIPRLGTGRLKIEIRHVTHRKVCIDE
jgi:hypothetical protein